MRNSFFSLYCLGNHQLPRPEHGRGLAWGLGLLAGGCVMDNCWGRSGVFALVFAALLLAFNWPLLSIPGPGQLLGWLFAAWVAAIALLGLAARGAAATCQPPPDFSDAQDGLPRSEDAAPGTDDV